MRSTDAARTRLLNRGQGWQFGIIEFRTELWIESIEKPQRLANHQQPEQQPTGRIIPSSKAKSSKTRPTMRRGLSQRRPYKEIDNTEPTRPPGR